MTDEDNLLSSLQEQVAALQASLEKAKEVLAPIQDEETKVNAEAHAIQEAYKAQMAEVQRKQIELRDKKYKAQVEANSVQNSLQQITIKINSLEAEKAKKIAQEEAAAKEAEERKALGNAFDTATMGAPWREWAKDHQVQAGHKIARDRYVILADPMGLGKTLSSIITSDMAEKTTKEASPEFPYLGLEEEVYVPGGFVWTQKADDARMLGEWPFTLTTMKSYLTGGPNPITGEKIPAYQLTYDLRQKLIAEGYVENQPAHYETKITNGIERPVGRKVLYFCPSALLRNVLEEWRRWAPHRNVTYIGNMSKAERSFVLDNTLPFLQEYVIIVNYEAWRRDKSLLDKLVECRFDTVIIDEAHNIKDMKTSSYKGVEQVILGCKPEYIIPMTGTPILNRPQELFSMLHLVNPKEFNNERDYLWTYCEEYYTDNSSTPKWKFKEGGLDRLSKKIHKNFLRRTKEQAGIILPEKSIIYHDLERNDDLYPDQAKAREHMKEYATIVIDESAGKAIQATAIIAMITRLRQIETWPAGIVQYDTYTDPITGARKIRKDPITGEKIVKLRLDVEESQKMDYIIRYDNSTGEWEGLIPDIVDDERLVIFSQFKAPLKELKRRIELMGRTAVVFDGDTPNDLRDEIRIDFDRRHTPDRGKAKWDVLLANYKAAGVGLNLTAATNMIVCDQEWNPGKRDQAFDRIHRIGQTENVTINVINVTSTIDGWLEGIMQEKEAVVGGFDSAMTNITATDLKDAIDSGLI